MKNNDIKYGELSKLKRVKSSKDEYFLGEGADGTKYYLESPSWDCGWYWGFGYIQGYKDGIHQSHEHADNFYPRWTLTDESRLVKTTFTHGEGWELAELFAEFYHLKTQAEFWKNGKLNLTNSIFSGGFKDAPLVKKINEEMLPKVMKRITDILSK